MQQYNKQRAYKSFYGIRSNAIHAHLSGSIARLVPCPLDARRGPRS